MERELIKRLTAALAEMPLIDPHTHINPHQPAAQTIDDLLGYHYYTELAHSVGMPHAPLHASFDPLERTRTILRHSQHYENTVQWSWFIELCQTFFGWESDRIVENDADCLRKSAQEKCSQPNWSEQVLKRSNIEKVFLTNDFDDPLTGFDKSLYVPCLRTDDLVFKLNEPTVHQRLLKATGTDVVDAKSLNKALDRLFVHFKKNGAKACAISLPPHFEPSPVSDQELTAAMKHKETEVIARGTFWHIAEHCREHRLPFDLMVGVNRRVYENGVFQGQDLFDQRTSLIQYARLFNAFPTVPFCISVLSSKQNQELASYSWIFPNVVTSGHWWYSNVPCLIEQDLAMRLQVVPMTKQIGYYSDAYKLEFVLPKFNMYRHILARLLTQHYVFDRQWSEERAVSLGQQLLRRNVESLFIN
ncbi:MAG TPA: glucuronate isomerase [Gemmatales bacterium]|nr:glucuronate isomerase [Gemmatales bacterium]